MEVWGYKLMLEMLKALSDENRLAILQILSERERIVGDLAGRLSLSEPTVSHHLARLREVGLVTLRMAGNKRFYRINERGLAEFKRLAADIEHLPMMPEPTDTDDSWIDTLGWEEFDQQVLREFTKGRHLTHLPVRQHKKLNVLLRWISTFFEPDRLYTEQEVNVHLKAIYETDYVSIRRDLIDFGYLRRERGGGKYWLTPTEEKIEANPQ